MVFEGERNDNSVDGDNRLAGSSASDAYDVEIRRSGLTDLGPLGWLSNFRGNGWRIVGFRGGRIVGSHSLGSVFLPIAGIGSALLGFCTCFFDLTTLLCLALAADFVLLGVDSFDLVVLLLTLLVAASL